jgi:hypothetical protein
VWCRIVAVLVVGLAILAFACDASANAQDRVCDLPKDLQREITSGYPGRTLVNLSDLDDSDRKLFLREHRNACPGLVKLDFYGDGLPTVALALTTRGAVNGKTELVIAHQIQTAWKTTTLETTDGPIPVLWSEKPGEYSDVYGEKEIRAANPVIVFCNYYAWAILYAWTNQRVAKIWLMD